MVTTNQGELFPVIEHLATNNNVISQRAHDGYVNATAICKAVGKRLNDYTRYSGTQGYIDELSAVTGIPATELIQTIQGGNPKLQGTWVHPQVAINLGQWASPKFAVLVSKWVVDWMSGSSQNNTHLPFHIRRYLVNRGKIPPTHFSMLDQMTIKLLAALEDKGYILPDNLMPDISLGKMFSSWLRDNGYDPKSFPTYEHVFDDGVRRPVQVRLYPNELMTEFNLQVNNWIRDGRALKYFGERDKASVLPLQSLLRELPPPTQ